MRSNFYQEHLKKIEKIFRNLSNYVQEKIPSQIQGPTSKRSKITDT